MPQRKFLIVRPIGYFPLAIELTKANSTRDMKMKIVLVRNQISIYFTYCTRDTLSLIFLWRLIKVSQLAVPLGNYF